MSGENVLITAGDWEQVWKWRLCMCGGELQRTYHGHTDSYLCTRCPNVFCHYEELTDAGLSVSMGYARPGEVLTKNHKYWMYERVPVEPYKHGDEPGF